MVLPRSVGGDVEADVVERGWLAVSRGDLVEEGVAEVFGQGLDVVAQADGAEVLAGLGRVDGPGL